MIPCFGYVRVSTQRQGEGVSLAAQKDAIQHYAQRSNLRIVGWFEETVTARKAGRPEFNQMVRSLRSGKAQGFVVHKIDRSARNYSDWGTIHALADEGIEVHVATENLDFRTRGGRLSADIQAVFAADYSRNLSDEVRKGQKKQIELGLYPFSTPIGYLSNGKAQPKVPDPAIAPFITLAFKLYATGDFSLRSLQKEMAARGLRSRKGRIVSRSSLEKVLESPFYCGTVHLARSGLTYAGKHQKLISPSLFAKVQKIKAGKAGKKTTKHNHLFRGLFHCAHCKGLLTGEWQKQKVYYRCHTIDCPSKTIREEVIDRVIYTLLQKHELSAEVAKWLTDKMVEHAKSFENSEEVQALTLQVDQANARLECLTTTLLDGLIDREEFQTRRTALIHERAGLAENLENLKEKAVPPERIEKFFERIKSVANNYRNAHPPEKREMAIWLTSNRNLKGKNLGIEPQKWLQETKVAACGLTCGDAKANFRTLIDAINGAC